MSSTLAIRMSIRRSTRTCRPRPSPGRIRRRYAAHPEPQRVGAGDVAHGYLNPLDGLGAASHRAGSSDCPRAWGEKQVCLTGQQGHCAARRSRCRRYQTEAPLPIMNSARTDAAQRQRDATALGLLDRAGFGHRTLALRGVQPLLHSREVVLDPVGDLSCIARPVLGAARQAPPARSMSSVSEPHPSSRAQAAAVSPRVAFCNTSARVRPAYGGLPVRISQRIAPRPKTSARSSTSSTSPAACSGAM